MRWDKEIEIILNKLSIKYSVDVNTVKDVVSTFFKAMKEVIQHPSMPSVLIHNFGKFTPDIRRLKAKRYQFEEDLKSVESEEEAQKLSEKIHRMGKVIDRLENEKTKRSRNEEE